MWFVQIQPVFDTFSSQQLPLRPPPPTSTLVAEKSVSQSDLPNELKLCLMPKNRRATASQFTQTLPLLLKLLQTTQCRLLFAC